MEKFSGLKFRKFDLHVHTPASPDFEPKNITPEQIVEKAIDQGLRGIAITDHNTGDWIDRIKVTAKSKNLVIFPGVEIYCTGGKSGIHIIGILDIEKGSDDIKTLLGRLKFQANDFGKTKSSTTLAPYDVIDVITNEYKGIAVLAHCTSSKGVLHDITGDTRTKIFEHDGLLAVETSENDFQNQEKIKNANRAIDLLNGKNPDYAYKRLGVYIASDSKANPQDDKHRLDGIGKKFTYFKVDDNVNLESLRQCFIDREVRIRQYFEFKENYYPHIKAIKINGGFFENETAIFHQGLNSILGAKGAGKSLLVEIMRFVLNLPSTQEMILDDHNRKLSKRLETYGSVEIMIVDETGVEHSIKRTYNLSEGNPYDEEEQENIVNSFPALFLSQNEIVKIAEDENVLSDMLFLPPKRHFLSTTLR